MFLANFCKSCESIMSFFYRQFIDVVKAKYLSVEHRVKMHSILSEYFSGQWSQGQLKPILLSSLNTQLNADRKVLIHSL